MTLRAHLLLPLLVLAACGDDEAKTPDTTAATTDAAATDSSSVEETTSAPSDTTDAADSSTAVDSTITDATTSTGDTAPEVFVPDPACNYIDLPRVVQCNGQYLSGIIWDTVTEGCTPYYVIGNATYASWEALAEARNCTCDFRSTLSVDALDCNGLSTFSWDVYRPEQEANCKEELFNTKHGLIINQPLCALQERKCWCIDSDDDGLADGLEDGVAGAGRGTSGDNCDDVPNPEQQDADGDLIGDACDSDIDGDGVANAADDDIDGDGVLNAADLCPNNADAPADCDGNPETPDEQCDSDDDGIPDACDPCAYDAENDADDDGVCGDVDNCPGLPNPRSDCDADPTTPKEQCDGDYDGTGDACDSE